jgi:hypothetical protein
MRVVILTRDGGDGGASINFTEGEMITGALNGRRVSAGGGGSSRARWSEARRSRVEEIKGEEGGGSDSLSSGKRRAAQHMETGELKGATWRGGWRRALGRSRHSGEDGVGGGAGN